MTRSLQEHPNAFAGRRFRNTGGLSGELSAGDVVAAGGVQLAAARAGWLPVTGPLAKACTRQHGTRPLPEPAPSGEPPPGPAAPAVKEDRDERPCIW